MTNAQLRISTKARWVAGGLMTGALFLGFLGNGGPEARALVAPCTSNTIMVCDDSENSTIVAVAGYGEPEEWVRVECVMPDQLWVEPGVRGVIAVPIGVPAVGGTCAMLYGTPGS